MDVSNSEMLKNTRFNVSTFHCYPREIGTFKTFFLETLFVVEYDDQFPVLCHLQTHQLVLQYNIRLTIQCAGKRCPPDFMESLCITDALEISKSNILAIRTGKYKSFFSNRATVVSGNLRYGQRHMYQTFRE